MKHVFPCMVEKEGREGRVEESGMGRVVRERGKEGRGVREGGRKERRDGEGRRERWNR